MYKKSSPSANPTPKKCSVERKLDLLSDTKGKKQM